MISSQLLFLFSALGAVNGIFVALYLFSRRSQRLANSMLGALLLAVGFRTAKATLYHFNPDLALEFLQAGLSACLLIGPLTWLYAHCCLSDLKQQAASKYWRLHLLVPFIVIVAGVMFPYSLHAAIWRHTVFGIYVYWLFIHAYWLLYLLLAGWELWQSRGLLRDGEGSFSRQSILLCSVYFSSVLIWAAYVSTPFTSYIIGALSLTFSIHVTILTFGLRNAAKVDAAKKEKYQNRKLVQDDALALVNSLDRVMREQQLYLNPNLSLALLAKRVGNLQTTVSQVINESLGKSFNRYINEFRIQHAKQLLINESHLNMELVAERSGFNSNSTFFSAFKRIAGQTPASYRAAYSSHPSSACAPDAGSA